MEIYSKNIYEVIENGKTKHILIIYNISGNHYVGISVHSENSKNYTFVQSINRFVDINDLNEYTLKNIKRLVYIKGKYLKTSNKDFINILKKLKLSLFEKLSNSIDCKNIDKLQYLKWCYDKILLEENSINISNLKSGSIVWINFGQNVGSELRKLRPAILWRSSADKKMWSVIPLSTKCANDKYYFHYDIDSLPCGTAKIESMTNFSYKRIREPFFYNKKIAHISRNDYNHILYCIKKYYAFEE